MRYPRTPLSPDLPTGLLLCGMGGPDGPADVEPYLRLLFSDPRILPVPRLLSPLLGRIVARRRAPAVRARYAAIDPGGGSPQLAWTRRQGERLAELLARRGVTTVLPSPAMRYWHPFPQEAVADAVGRGAEQFLLVPLYPQYADAVSGAVLDASRAAARDVCPSLPVHVVTSWHLLPGYLQSLADSAAGLLRPWATAGEEPATCALLLAAHSLPERFIARGDPYLGLVRATVAAVRERLDAIAAAEGWAEWLAAVPGGRQPLLAFQGRVGPIRWIGPDIRDEVERLAASGCRRLAVQPVSFTCEHIETLHELDIELKAAAEAAGVVAFARGPALGLDETWLASLADHLYETAFTQEETARV